MTLVDIYLGSMNHQRRLTCLAVTLLLASCKTHTGPSESRGITVYEHPNYDGNSRTFDGNVWDLDDVRGPCYGFFDSDEVGDWDDCISSIRVPSGWEAIVFEHDEYEGEMLTVTSDIADLDDVRGPCGNDWDDCISSIQVRAPQP
jgi:hypothetical protein